MRLKPHIGERNLADKLWKLLTDITGPMKGIDAYTRMYPALKHAIPADFLVPGRDEMTALLIMAKTENLHMAPKELLTQENLEKRSTALSRNVFHWAALSGQIAEIPKNCMLVSNFNSQPTTARDKKSPLQIAFYKGFLHQVPQDWITPANLRLDIMPLNYLEISIRNNRLLQIPAFTPLAEVTPKERAEWWQQLKGRDVAENPKLAVLRSNWEHLDAPGEWGSL